MEGNMRRGAVEYYPANAALSAEIPSLPTAYHVGMAPAMDQANKEVRLLPIPGRREEVMKKVIMVLMAVTLFTATVPALALAHGGGHDPADVECARDCELMLKNCAMEVDTIQQKIKKLEVAIKKEGANPETVANVRALQHKLDDAKETLRSLEEGGK
jgi:hypothetical protein